MSVRDGTLLWSWLTGRRFSGTPPWQWTAGRSFSWAITNTGPHTLNYPFYVDLYFDGVLADRWQFEFMSVNFFGFVESWDRLPGLVRLRPGTHTLKMVVDSTDLIPETDESDNEFEAEFTWSPSAQDFPTPTPIPNRLPDLVPFAPEGWGAPLIATSYAGDTVDGPLSTDVPSYVRAAIRNQGLSSTPEDVWIYLYLDGLLVDRRMFEGFLADTSVASIEWERLFEIVNVSAGVHTLKVVVDPNDLVEESDEANNSFEKQLTWGTGPVPSRPLMAADALPPQTGPLTLPNLVPGWRYGWDGPIIVSHQQGTFLNSPLTVDMRPLIDVVVYNRSVVATAPFSVDLYFDGEKVHTVQFSSSLGAGFVGWVEDWEGLPDTVQLTEGPHTLRIVIDASNTVVEANEEDNVYEQTFTWAAGVVAEVEPIAYTDAELRGMLAGLAGLLETTTPVLSPDGTDRTEEVLDVVEARYYLITGRSLLNERVTISLLTRRGFLDWLDESCAEDLAVAQEAERTSVLAECERAKEEFLGFKTRRFGKAAVVVDAERSPAEVINSLAHELGHMYQDFLNPAQVEADDFFFLQAVQEAQAQQFERILWLTLEEFTRLSLLAYPDYPAYHRMVDDRLDFWLRNADQDEHWLGHLLQWLAVLNDPALGELREELLSSGGLGASSALRLYNHLVGLSPEAVRAYVAELIGTAAMDIESAKAIAVGRLIPGLHPDSEGLPALRIPGLLAP